MEQQQPDHLFINTEAQFRTARDLCERSGLLDEFYEKYAPCSMEALLAAKRRLDEKQGLTDPAQAQGAAPC